jgi:hypothetical protein
MNLYIQYANDESLCLYIIGADNSHASFNTKFSYFIACRPNVKT